MLAAVQGVISFLIRVSASPDDIELVDPGFVEKYSVSGDDYDEAVDAVQQEFSCCGVRSFSDWTTSVWMRNHEKMKVPDSCCKTMTQECGVRDHPSNIAYVGCLQRYANIVRPTQTNLINITISAGVT